MKKFVWKNTIKMNILMLKLVGLWPKGTSNYSPSCYTLYAFISINLFINGHTFFQAVNIFFVYSDLEALAATIFVTSAEALAAFKVVCYVQNIKTLKELMIQVENGWFQPENPDQKEVIQPNLRIWKGIYVGFWIPAALTMSSWALVPVLSHSVKHYRLPFSAWYPYDTKTSPFYEITYAYQVIGVWFLGTANLNIDTMNTALLIYVGAQCDMLCHKLRNLKDDGYNEKLIGCVKHHRELISFAEKSNSFFNSIATGQIVTSVISNAISMFRLSLVGPLSTEFYSLLLFLGTITVQLFLYCWFGNEVEIKRQLFDLGTLVISTSVCQQCNSNNIQFK